MNNKLIQVITSDNRFAFVYILTFLFVIFMAVFKQAGSPWNELAWAMLSLLGVIISITAMTSFFEAIASQRWPRCHAKIVKTYVSSSLAGGDSKVYSPVVHYSYTFEGKAYSGDQIDFSAASASEKWAKGIIERVTSKGDAFSVAVNPAVPEISVIYPGPRLVHYLRFIIGPVLIIAGIIGGFGVIKVA